MKRFVANLGILTVLTIAISAILAMMSGPTRVSDSDDDAEAAASTSADPAPAASQDDPAADPETTVDAAEATTEDAPTHLSPDEPAAEVAGVAQTADGLADTGPPDARQWLIIAAALIAAGGTLRGAARDHATGKLTVL